jgi:large subunit ribosomal protein L29
MPNKSADELRTLEPEELATRLVETKHELFNLRFQHVTGQLDNYARLGDLKREIARIQTLLRAQEIEAAEKLEAEQSAAGQAAGTTEEGVTNG